MTLKSYISIKSNSIENSKCSDNGLSLNHKKFDKVTKRIIGIDVARAIAIIGMIIVNFKIVFGTQGSPLLQSMTSIFDGKAAACFVVLAGVGIAFMTNSALKDNNLEKLKIAKRKILKRALFLFIVGLSYVSIWPADILHFYGVYMLITITLLNLKTVHILVISIMLIMLYPILMLCIDYETGWNFSTLEYLEFWSFSGFTRNLFYNGFHPVMPWTAFMLYGLWLGRLDLHDDKILLRLIKFSSIAFLVIQAISYFSIELLSGYDLKLKEDFVYILGTSPMPPLPIYMLNGMAISTFVISVCIWLGNKYEDRIFIILFKNMGQLALTFYVAHVVIGMGLVDIIGSKEFGEYSMRFSFLYALSFCFVSIIFASVWLKYFKSGPLEFIMRKLTN